MRQRTWNCHWVPFLLAIYWWAWAMLLKVVCYRRETPIEKAEKEPFVCSGFQWKTTSKLGRKQVSISLSSETQLGADPTGPAQASSVFVSASVHLPCCVQKPLLPWCRPFPLALNILSAVSSILHPRPCEGGIWWRETSHLELNVPSSLTLCTLPCRGTLYLFPPTVGETSLMVVEQGIDIWD